MVRGLGRFVTDADGPGARVLVRNSGTDMFREGSAEAYARGVAAGRAGAAGEDRSGVGTPGGAAAPGGAAPGGAERLAREAGYADGYRDGFTEGFREGTGNPQQG